MALEPFSIATGALQVASAGIKLAETLYTYIHSVRKAEKQLKPIADHVKLTLIVLENVGALLKKDQTRQLYTKDLLGSTQDTLSGYEGVFNDLDKFIHTLVKPDKPGSFSLSTSAKLAWSFRQRELDVLQAHLERFKSSLDLVLGVLNLVSSMKYV